MLCTLLSPIFFNKTFKKEFILSERMIVYKIFRLKEKTISIISYEIFKKSIIKNIIKYYFI